MTVADTFFKQFEILADAPNAVPRLRELILQLAVRGKLVSQDPNDEPASILLSTLKEKQSSLNFEETKVNNALWELPRNWEWTKLSNVATIIMGQSPPSDTYNTHGEGIPLINGPTEFGFAPFAETRINQFTNKPTKLCNKGDLLICVRGGTTGRTNIAGVNACIGRGVAAIRAKFFQPYINLYVLAFKQKIYELGTGSTFPSVSQDKIVNLPFSLPPLNEQKRIVEKVDKLMEWCDRLEKQQKQRRETCINLNRVALTQLTTATTTDEFSDRWQKVHDNFDLLYSLPENVSQLRQTILQLAVMGKLVKQDPNDEPASILLQKIKDEKDSLIKEKKIRKSELLDPIADDSLPYTVPKSWKWIKLDHICFLITDGTHHTPSYVDSGVPFLSVKDVAHGRINLSNTRFIAKEEHEVLKKRCNPEFEDVLLTKVGTTGIAKVIDIKSEFSIFVSVALLKFSKQLLSPYYIELAINSPLIKEQSDRDTQGVSNKNLVLKYNKNFLFPLPPLNEQKRIVAKVDEMMRLCDGLEAKLKDAETNRQKLLESGIRQVLSQI